MSKKYVVRCDIEGVSEVVSFEQAEPGKPEYAFGQRMFMADLLALLEGLKAGGADEVVIYDEHYYGRCIDLSVLPDYAIAGDFGVPVVMVTADSAGTAEAEALLPGDQRHRRVGGLLAEETGVSGEDSRCMTPLVVGT